LYRLLRFSIDLSIGIKTGVRGQSPLRAGDQVSRPAER
jgi:hypothetical protein